MLGQTVLFQSIKQSAGHQYETIDASHLPKGQYVLEINSGDGVVQKTFLSRKC